MGEDHGFGEVEVPTRKSAQEHMANAVTGEHQSCSGSRKVALTSTITAPPSCAVSFWRGHLPLRLSRGTSPVPDKVPAPFDARSVPAEWTGAGVEDPFELLVAGRSSFRTQNGASP